MLTRSNLVVALASFVVASGAPGSASADDNRYAVATIYNRTRDVTIHFDYRWGDGEWKRVKNLKPGRAEWISFDLNDQGNAPRLQMRINEAVGNAKTYDKVFNLRWRRAPDRGVKFGHPFSIKRDTQDNEYVSVYDDAK
jgi:hypothetical protein